MSSLKDAEKQYFEKLLGMSTGYVLDYTDATYGDFFRKHGINIHGPKYQQHGTSKAKKMRAFWDLEPDALVGRVLSEMLDIYEANCELYRHEEIDSRALEDARRIVGRLLGKPQEKKPKGTTGKDFLREDFEIPSIDKLPIESTMVPIIESRLVEVRKVLKAEAYLASVILCGSILEAVLLGAAQQKSALFNSSRYSPKTTNGQVKKIQNWNLASLIDVASEVGILEPDVKKFSHGLRYFRNYIHPYAQMASRFTPDEHTANVCYQVLKAALASVAGERKGASTKRGTPS